jgi:hypothetical protein
MQALCRELASFPLSEARKIKYCAEGAVHQSGDEINSIGPVHVIWTLKPHRTQPTFRRVPTVSSSRPHLAPPAAGDTPPAAADLRHGEARGAPAVGHGGRRRPGGEAVRQVLHQRWASPVLRPTIRSPILFPWPGFAPVVLELMREAQMQHGLRQSDYTRYRFVISSALHPDLHDPS